MCTNGLATSDTSIPTAQKPHAALLVRLGQQRYGLPLASVERVLPMAYVFSLPDTGNGLVGVLNLHGRILPVVNPRPRLGLATPSIAAEHRLVLLVGSTPFLLWVDDVEEVVSTAEDALSAVPAPHSAAVVLRVLRLDDAIVPVLAPAALEPHGTSG
jgi:purine-binding chemotaxis protein CheW